MKQILQIYKINIIHSTAIFILTLLIIIFNLGSNPSSMGNYFYLPIIIVPTIIVFDNFKKFVNIGANKFAYYYGSILTYISIALIGSGINLLFFAVIDNKEIWNLIDIFKWGENGLLMAFIQQFVFLFMFALFLHVLLFLQNKWIGWVADILLIAIISVFTPITPLRNALVWFLSLFVGNDNAVMQIINCITVSILLYLAGLFSLKKTRI